jgi:hypothetical protein
MIVNYKPEEPRLTITEIPLNIIAVDITRETKERFTPSNGMIELGNFPVVGTALIELIEETVFETATVQG